MFGEPRPEKYAKYSGPQSLCLGDHTQKCILSTQDINLCVWGTPPRNVCQVLRTLVSVFGGPHPEMYAKYSGPQSLCLGDHTQKCILSTQDISLCVWGTTPRNVCQVLRTLVSVFGGPHPEMYVKYSGH